MSDFRSWISDFRCRLCSTVRSGHLCSRFSMRINVVPTKTLFHSANRSAHIWTIFSQHARRLVSCSYEGCAGLSAKARLQLLLNMHEGQFYNVQFRKALLRELQQQQGIRKAAEHATWLDSPKDALRKLQDPQDPQITMLRRC